MNETKQTSEAADTAFLIDYPLTAAAIAAVRETFKLPRLDYKDRRERLRQDRVHAAAEEARMLALTDEILPRLLPGRGKWRSANSLPFGAHTTELLDHTTAFQRQGQRGKATWNNSVVVSEPYAIGGGNRSPKPDTIAAAREMMQQTTPIPVLYSAELSMWYPKWTLLCVASQMLTGIQAPPGWLWLHEAAVATTV